MVPKSEAKILNSLKLLWDSQGNGRFTTDSQVCKWMSNGNPRTGMLHQTLPMAGDTACSVKGVLTSCTETTVQSTSGLRFLCNFTGPYWRELEYQWIQFSPTAGTP